MMFVRKARAVRKSQLFLVAGLTAAVGVVVLVNIFAAGTPTAFEAESGALANGAVISSATGQSGSGVVKFKSAAVAPTPTPTSTPSPGACPVATPNAPDGPDPWGGCWPGPTTTGVDMSQCPGGLTASGSLTITVANTTISCKDIAGTVHVQASNVTIINSKIHDPGLDMDNPTIYPISGNVIVRRSEIYHTGIAAFGYDNVSLYGVNAHDLGCDGIKLGGNNTIQDSYFHDWTPGLKYAEGDHTDTGGHSDGGQIQGGTSNVVVRHNYINTSVKAGFTPQGDGNYTNAALFLAPDLGPNGNGPVIIDKNILGASAYYTANFLDGNNGQYHQKGYAVTNNRFLRSSNNTAYRSNEPTSSFTAWCGNVYNNDGAAISGPINTVCQ